VTELLQQALDVLSGPDPQSARSGSQSPVDFNNNRVHSWIAEGSPDGKARETAPGDFPRRHSFSVLPSRKAPRWLLPLGSPGATLESLRVYTPYALPARIKKLLLLGALKTGWTGWARHKVFVASQSFLPLEVLVSDVTGEAKPFFALSLGTPGRFRKLTMQVMRSNGEILGYIKLPLTEAAIGRLRYEAAVLEQLWNFDALRPHIPRVLHAGEWGNAYILFESRGPSRPGPKAFGPLHEEFLQNLRRVRQSVKPGRVVVDGVAARWREWRSLLNAEWISVGERALEKASRELESTPIPCGISHGDFAPWNTRIEGERLFVFDWESAAWEAPIEWDAFHFRAQVVSLLKGNNGRDFSQDGHTAQRSIFLLYLLNSLCQSLEEEPLIRDGIDYRLRLLREIS
jgi:phosphotransferase family enzyme